MSFKRLRVALAIIFALAAASIVTDPVAAQSSDDCAERGGTATCSLARLSDWDYQYCELPLVVRHPRECGALAGGIWDSVDGCTQVRSVQSDADYLSRIRDYHLWNNRRCDIGVDEIEWATGAEAVGTPMCWTGNRKYINGKLSFHLGAVSVGEFIDENQSCERAPQRDHTDWVLKTRNAICPAGSYRQTLPTGEVVCVRQTTSVCRGNPVGALSGCKIETVADFAEPSGLEFVRRYESHGFDFRPLNDSPSRIPTGTGRYWRHSYQVELVATPSSAHTLAAVQRANGVVWYFDKSGEQTAPVGGVGAQLRLKAGGDWILTTADGDRERFDSSGRIQSRNAAGKLALQFVWSTRQTSVQQAPGPGYLIGVTTRNGHAISIAYSDEGLIKRVTDSAGRAHRFAWDDQDRLESVRTAGVRRYGYHYEDVRFPQALTGVTDGEGERYATWEYDAAGLAIVSSHADTGNGAQNETRFIRTADTVQVLTPGREERLRFDRDASESRVTRTENPTTGSIVQYRYDSEANLVTVVEAGSRRLNMTYNEYGQMESRTRAAGSSVSHETQFTYLSPDSSTVTAESRPSVLPSARQTLKRKFDGQQNVVQEKHRGFAQTGEVHKRVTRYTYDQRGRKTQVDGPRSDVGDTRKLTWHDCDAGGRCGMLASNTDALGHVTRYPDYDSAGRVKRMIDPNGVQTFYDYDNSGRVVAINRKAPDGSSRETTMSYDANGNRTELVRPSGSRRSYAWDAAQLMSSMTDSLGNRIEYSYDRRGNLTNTVSIDTAGSVEMNQQREFDSEDRLRSVSRGGVTTSSEYNDFGETSEEIDGKAAVSARYTYDELGRMTAFEDAVGAVARFGYDVNDSVARVTAANGAVTSYSWDDLGNLRREQGPDRGQLMLDYDRAGNLVERVDARSNQTRFSWDALNRVTSINYVQSNLDISVFWDTCLNGAGRLCGYTDESGTTRYEYNPFGNVLTDSWRTGSSEFNTRYTWNNDDALTSIRYPGGTRLKIKRDSEGRIVALTLKNRGDSRQIVSDRQSRVDGQTSSQILADNLLETRSYDSRGRLTGHRIQGVDERSYRYDANDNMVGWVDGGGARDYYYSARDELISESHTGSSGSGSRSYIYDANGNQTWRAVDGQGVSRTINTGSNLMIEAGPDQLPVDASGNRITDTHRGIDLVWDSRGRLRRVNRNGQRVAIYTYNARGQRATKIVRVNGVAQTTRFHYDILGRLIAESVEGVFVREYYWDDKGIVAQMNPQTGFSSLRWFVQDPASATRTAFDAQANVVWQWRPDGFGNGEAQVFGSVDDNGVNVRFDGQYLDAETGYHYNWHRYYDPLTARYLSPDPLGLLGGLNPYDYVDANPMTLSDPTGLDLPLGGLGLPTRGFRKACGAGDLAGKIPDGFLFYDFGPACSVHDRCYETCGKSREVCDQEFLTRLKWACGRQQFAQNQACRSVARVYAFVTRKKGEQYFQAAQSESRCNECKVIQAKSQ